MSNRNSPGDSAKDDAYKEGFEDGRNGNGLDDAVMALFGGLVGSAFDGPHQDIYNKGVEEGRKNRD